MNLRTLIILSILIHSSQRAFPQMGNETSRHIIRFSTGIGFDDGLAFTTIAPTIGMGYEYVLNKRLSFATHLLSFYRNAADYFSLVNAFGDTAADVVIAGFSGPFISREELKEISETGIKKLSPERTLKYLSVPVDVGISFYPIVTKRHRLGINCAFSLTYESHNHPPGQYSVELELKDGTIYRDIFISLNTEFNQFALGAGVKLFYEYHFKDYALGLRIGNYNVFDGGLDALGSGLPIWENSIYFAFKL